MKKHIAVTTTAVSLGVATLLTISSMAPAMAKTHNTSGSSFSSSSSRTGANGTPTPGATPVAPKFTTVNFTVTGVPAAYTDAATAASHIVFKVVPVAADATSAPATPPVPAFGKGGKGDHDGDGPGAGASGGWTPPAASGSSSSSTATPAPAPTGAPTFGAPTAGAPTFGTPDNDGDGPAAGAGAGFGKGHGGHGDHGKGRGPGFGPGTAITNLVLTNGTLTGTISVPAGRTAGVQKFAVYPTVVADSANNVAAKTGTPVLLTVTTAADGTATVAASAAITVSFN